MNFKNVVLLLFVAMFSLSGRIQIKRRQQPYLPHVTVDTLSQNLSMYLMLAEKHMEMGFAARRVKMYGEQMPQYNFREDVYAALGVIMSLMRKDIDLSRKACVAIFMRDITFSLSREIYNNQKCIDSGYDQWIEFEMTRDGREYWLITDFDLNLNYAYYIGKLKCLGEWYRNQHESCRNQYCYACNEVSFEDISFSWMRYLENCVLPSSMHVVHVDSRENGEYHSRNLLVPEKPVDLYGGRGWCGTFPCS